MSDTGQIPSTRRLRRYFYKASIGPLAVMVVVLVVSGWGNGASLLLKYPWRPIFALGILASLWCQSAVHFYFHDVGYHKLVTLGWMEEHNSFTFPIVSSFLVLLALLTLEGNWHMLWTLIYLFFVALVDGYIWKAARAASNIKPEDVGRVDEFKESCRQLLLHIDGAVFVVIAVWAIISWSINYFANEYWTFSFSRELSEKHLLSEPLLAGVVGCHMLLTLWLLCFHLWGWQNGKLLKV